jgi:hypothetical protein
VVFLLLACTTLLRLLWRASFDKCMLHITVSHVITALFRMEFAGRGELSERQQKLGQHLGHLVRLAEEFNIAIVVINQCMADPGEYIDWQRCTAVCFHTVVPLVSLLRYLLVLQFLFDFILSQHTLHHLSTRRAFDVRARD